MGADLQFQNAANRLDENILSYQVGKTYGMAMVVGYLVIWNYNSNATLRNIANEQFVGVV